MPSPFGKDRKERPRSRDQKSSGNGKEKSVKTSDRRACFICGDPKHWARECPHREELLRVNKEQKSRKSPSPSPSIVRKKRAVAELGVGVRSLAPQPTVSEWQSGSFHRKPDCDL